MRKILIATFLTTSLICAVSSSEFAIALESSDPESCINGDFNKGVKERSIEVSKVCDDKKRSDSDGSKSNPSPPAPSGGAKFPPSYIKTVIVSGCVPDQPVNPDFGSCVEQRQKFCPEGEWLQARSIDTRTPQDDPAYGDPFCTGEPPAAAPPGAAGAPPVSIDEIRTLLVLRPEIESDNAGRGVRNAETNFYTLTEPVSMTTVLAGQQVELRATPVRFRWDYGDGTGPITTLVGGHPQSEFNAPTPTSHVYEETGSYTVGLTTVYVGEYRVAGGAWQLIPGTITLDAPPVTADIWRTVTRNVADDCAADSSAWGCTGPIEEPGGG